MPIADPRALLREAFAVAVAAADPRSAVAAHLPDPPRGRTVVVGAGKAAAAMAAAFEHSWPRRCEGIVIVRDGYVRPTRAIEIVEAGHPLPDARGAAATARVLDLVRGAGADDLVVALISGGASALLVAPRPGVSLAEKQAITRALLNGGAPIDQINGVRKHLSTVKGGQLAAAASPARVVALIVSDVVGDDVGVIGSGPTAADPTTCADALNILARHRIAVSATIRDGLVSGAWETPKAIAATVDNRIIARPAAMLAAVADWAARQGLSCLNLGDGFDQSAAEIAADHARRIAAIVSGRAGPKPPCLVISGGEAVVTVSGHGTGGPNTEFALHLALLLGGAHGVYVLAADTDGTDGIGGHAGAVIAPETLARATHAGLDPRRALSNSDSAGVFAALDDLLVTGPTFTNVNDFRAVLIDAPD
ncbi:MAG: DUF4147 domain-containing protein [Rhodospirillaceae bacterium]|nr:DUF4147 domain-containing protein [Rhodospirillaceae bacterium]